MNSTTTPKVPNAAEWVINTTLPEAAINAFLKQHAPWRINVQFSNGIAAFDFGKVEPAAAFPLAKQVLIRQHVPAEAFKGRVLDVGHNIGHNSISIAQRDGADVVGIDYNPGHQVLANWLAEAAGTNVAFKQADAQTYCEPGAFSLVLHLGTLYHLENPVQSLQMAARNLRSGGWLALETVAYVGPGAENHLNRWFYGYNGDKTNYWALAKPTIEEILAISGMEQLKLAKEVHLPIYRGEMSRVLYVGTKR